MVQLVSLDTGNFSGPATGARKVTTGKAREPSRFCWPRGAKGEVTHRWSSWDPKQDIVTSQQPAAKRRQGGPWQVGGGVANASRRTGPRVTGTEASGPFSAASQAKWLSCKIYWEFRVNSEEHNTNTVLNVTRF